jgi:hypothetical protein
LQLDSGIVDGVGNPIVPKTFALRAATTIDNSSPAVVQT